jgi:OMF family outer membrane factor
MESAMNTLNDALGQISIRKRQVELATRNYELTEAAYKVGKDTQLNLLDETMELRFANLVYMNSLLNSNSAYNALLKATGEF